MCCRCVPIQQIPGGDETAAIQFTFYNEVARIPALISSTVATHQAIQRAFQVTVDTGATPCPAYVVLL